MLEPCLPYALFSAFAFAKAVASEFPSPPLRVSFSGPYSRLLCVRASGWARRFEDCMVDSAEAKEIEDSQDSLSGVEASLCDLIPPSPSLEMAGKNERITYEIGRSIVNKMMIDNMVSEGWFEKDKVKLPGLETVPDPPNKDYAVVFRDFFVCGLRFIPRRFLREVLDEFNVQIHQLTPNGIAQLSKFAWACESYGATPDIDSFCQYYELQKQNKKFEGAICQYGSCSFFPKRKQVGPRCELSYCQKNKWDKDWTLNWFYVRTPGYTVEEDDGKKVTRYPLASVMTPMEPRYSIPVPAKFTASHTACNRAFALACRYSGGRDLVEEMVAAKCWPLAKSRPSFHLEMVQLPVFGDAGGVPFPRFGLTRPANKTDAAFVRELEANVYEIVGEYSDKEYLARRTEAGNMPRLNRVLEEMGVKYGDHPVPAKLIAAIRDKEAAAAEVRPSDAPKPAGRKRRGASSGAGAGRGKKLRSSARSVEASEHVEASEPAEVSAGRAASSSSSGSAATSLARHGRGDEAEALVQAPKLPEGRASSKKAPVEAAGASASVAPFASVLGAFSDDSEDSVHADAGTGGEAKVSSREGTPASVGASPPHVGGPVPEVAPEAPQVAPVPPQDPIAPAPQAVSGASGAAAADALLGLAQVLARDSEAAPDVDMGRIGLDQTSQVPPPFAGTSFAGFGGSGEADSMQTLSGWSSALHSLHQQLGGGTRRYLERLDYFSLLRLNLEQQSVSHHIAEAMEARCSHEVLKRDEALGALKEEVETLGAEKKTLTSDLAELRPFKKAAEDLELKLKSSEKKLEDAQTASAVLEERLKKANDVNVNLRSEVESEKQAAAMLRKQVEELQKQLDDAKEAAITLASAYSDAIHHYGGVVPPLPEDPSTFAVLDWMRSRLSHFPKFVDGIADFAAVSCAKNFVNALTEVGCEHLQLLKGKATYSDPKEVVWSNLRMPMRVVRDFMRYCWSRFGRSYARMLAEERNAEAEAERAAKRAEALKASQPESSRRAAEKAGEDAEVDA